jgi:hypothetical protein
MFKRFKLLATSLLVLATIVVGCASMEISRYDNETYANLCYTKADVVKIYANYSHTPQWAMVAGSKVGSFDRMLEYEVNKEYNDITYKQILIIKEMYLEHMKNLPWTPAQHEIYSDNIAKAFDIAIDTEKSKNR